MSVCRGRRRFAAVTLVVAGVALIGAACSDDHTDGAGQAASTTTASSTTVDPANASDTSSTTIAGADATTTTDTAGTMPGAPGAAGAGGGAGSATSPPSSRPGTIAGSPALTPPASASDLPSCTSSQLAAGPAKVTGAMGTVADTFPLTNRSGAACSLAGIPGVRFLGGEGGAFDAAVSSHGEDMVHVTLASGEGTVFTIFSHNETGFSPAVCQTASTVEITLPGTGGKISFTANVRPCGDGAGPPAVSVTPIGNTPAP